MERRIKEQYIAMVLDRVWNQYSENIVLQAMTNYAYVVKYTQEIINKKVSKRAKYINDQIQLINSNYNESLKHFDVTKIEILDSITNYEDSLKKYSLTFDEEIQNIILEIVEYETRKLGLLLKDEYLEEKEELREENKKNITKTITKSIKNIMGKMSTKDDKKYIDVSLYNDAMDMDELQSIVKKRVDKKLQHVRKHNKENDDVQEKINNRIIELNNQLDELINNKINYLKKAMESKEKWIAIYNSKESVFDKIRNLISYKFATHKVIHNRIIEPFNELINNFKKEKLANQIIKSTDMETFKKQINKVNNKTENEYISFRELNIEKVKQANEEIKVG